MLIPPSIPLRHPGLFGLPSRSGKLADLASFDASFFAVHGKQANVMDPQLRMLLELVYEAIVDAGEQGAEAPDVYADSCRGRCRAQTRASVWRFLCRAQSRVLTACGYSQTLPFHSGQESRVRKSWLRLWSSPYPRLGQETRNRTMTTAPTSFA